MGTSSTLSDVSLHEEVEHVEYLLGAMELSHRPHMVYNLFSLWKTVNPGGLFVVEDIETCYWKSGSKVKEDLYWVLLGIIGGMLGVILG